MKTLILPRKNDWSTVNKKTDWWDNFMNSLPDGNDTTAELWYERRDQHLAAYGSVLVYHHGDPALEFDTEANCTAFLLRFS